MSIRQQIRRQKALARFDIMTGPQWFAQRAGWPDAADSLGAILGAATEQADYQRYVNRKKREDLGELTEELQHRHLPRLVKAMTNPRGEQPMTDTDDDWMNPTTSTSFSFTPRTGVEWEIQRKRRLITFGSPVYQWDHWETFESEKAMWSALDKLRTDHPSWHLRGRRRDHDLERIGIYPSDDEEDFAYELFRRGKVSP